MPARLANRAWRPSGARGGIRTPLPPLRYLVGGAALFLSGFLIGYAVSHLPSETPVSQASRNGPAAVRSPSVNAATPSEPEPTAAATAPARPREGEAMAARRLPAPPTVAEPPWRKNAAAVAPFDGQPAIAILIDDLGHDMADLEALSRLRAPLSLAILPYPASARTLAARARRLGFEILVHVPMEPQRTSADPGPHVLKVDMDAAEFARTLEWNLSQFDGYVGVNNHMGSRFTSDATAMRRLLAELKRRGLLFIDSRTTHETVGAILGRILDVPSAERDVFLDPDGSASDVAGQLVLLEERARAQGYAIGIGHPFATTIAALGRWVPAVRRRGVALVPVSAIMKAGEVGLIRIRVKTGDTPFFSNAATRP